MNVVTLFFVVSAVAMTGCAACPSATANSVPTSTTRITAAEVTVSEDAPRVGKPQHESALKSDEDDAPTTPKDGRRSDRHGGFSGYK